MRLPLGVSTSSQSLRTRVSLRRPRRKRTTRPPTTAPPKTNQVSAGIALPVVSPAHETADPGARVSARGGRPRGVRPVGEKQQVRDRRRAVEQVPALPAEGGKRPLHHG